MKSLSEIKLKLQQEYVSAKTLLEQVHWVKGLSLVMQSSSPLQRYLPPCYSQVTSPLSPPVAVQQMSGLARGGTLYNDEQEALEELGGTEGGQARWAMM